MLVCLVCWEAECRSFADISPQARYQAQVDQAPMLILHLRKECWVEVGRAVEALGSVGSAEKRGGGDYDDYRLMFG